MDVLCEKLSGKLKDKLSKAYNIQWIDDKEQVTEVLVFGEDDVQPPPYPQKTTVTYNLVFPYDENMPDLEQQVDEYLNRIVQEVNLTQDNNDVVNMSDPEFVHRKGCIRYMSVEHVKEKFNTTTTTTTVDKPDQKETDIIECYLYYCYTPSQESSSPSLDISSSDTGAFVSV